MSHPSTRPWIAAGLDVAIFTQAAMLFCLAAGFLFPTNASWSMACYVLLTPLVILRVWRGWRPNWRDPALLSMLALLLWSTAAIFWEHDVTGQGDGAIYWLRNAGCTLVFLLAFLMAQSDDALARGRIILTLIFCGAANAVLSLGIDLVHGEGVLRQPGWGITLNPVLGAAIMGICLVLAIGHAKLKSRLRFAILAAAGMMLIYIICSISRTPEIATGTALCILLLGGRLRAWGFALLGAVALFFLLRLLTPNLLETIWQQFAARGEDCHVQIWQSAWAQIELHPLTGSGPAARLPIRASGFCPQYPSPHNLYLSLLLYSGVIGLFLFFATVALLGVRVRLAASGSALRSWAALGIIPLIAGLTDLSQLIKGPSPVWYIIWLPMLLVLTMEQPAGNNKMSIPASPPRG